MPKSKNTPYYGLSGIKYCAVGRALCLEKDVCDMEMRHAIRKREQMILSALGQSGVDAVRFLKHQFAEENLLRRRIRKFTINLGEDHGNVLQIYIEFELADLASLKGNPKTLKLKCGHVIVQHIRALNNLWKKFPKVPKKKQQ